MQNYNKILIIQTAFIGDVILASALLESVHKHRPTAEISICVRKGNERLFENHPYLKEVITWDKKNGKNKQLLKTLKSIRKNKYDAVVNVQRYLSSGILTAFSGAKLTVGFSSNPLSWLFNKKYPHSFDSGLHEIERNVQLLEPLKVSTIEKPRLYPKTGIPMELPSEFITISPASVWRTKAFPISGWVDFLNAVPNENILLMGGPGDFKLLEEIKTASSNANIINACKMLSFLESAAVMKKAKMNYVNDSAPLHICSAMDAPVAAIFCSTSPRFGFGPLSTHSNIIEIKRDLECKPCGVHGRKSCPLTHFACGKEITSKQLISALP